MVLRILLWLNVNAPRLYSQRIFFGAMISFTLFASLHVSSYVTSGNKRKVHSAPEWLRDEGGQCLPRTNIGHLKSHKCASSAIQNILFRYGLKNRLHFVLPDVDNYFGGGRKLFHSGMVFTSPWSKLPPNIFTIHTKWNHKEIQLVMPEDTVYITSVRDPVDLFESLYVYTNMKKTYNMSVEEYALKMAPEAPRFHGFVGFNQMVWDFGMPMTHMNNMTAVEELVKQADEEFELVMVAERMEESLVLMAHLLCWDLKDVLVLRINARNDKFKNNLRKEAKKVLREKLAPDYLLYDHFVRKFDELVGHFGRDRMAREVDRLRRLTKQLMKNCSFVQKNADLMSGPDKPYSRMVDGYKAETGNTQCAHYSRSEHAFINLLRTQQKREVSRKFHLPQQPGLDALPLGPYLLQNPGSAMDNIETLKKMLIHTESKKE